MKVKDIDSLRTQISHDSREAFTKHQVWLLASEHNKTTPTFDAIPMSVIEDIKAEIKALAQEYDFYADTRRKYGLWIALEIIDKHCGKGTDE